MYFSMIFSKDYEPAKTQQLSTILINILKREIRFL